MSENQTEQDKFKAACSKLKNSPFDESSMNVLSSLLSREIETMQEDEEEFDSVYFIKVMRVFKMEILKKMKKMKLFSKESDQNPMPKEYKNYLVSKSVMISNMMIEGNYPASFSAALDLYDELSIVG